MLLLRFQLLLMLLLLLLLLPWTRRNLTDPVRAAVELLEMAGLEAIVKIPRTATGVAAGLGSIVVLPHTNSLTRRGDDRRRTVAGSVATRLLPLLRELLLLMLMLVVIIGRRGQEGMIPLLPLDPAPIVCSRVALRIFAGSRITAGLLMLPIGLLMLSLLLSRIIVGSGISATVHVIKVGFYAVLLLFQLLLLLLLLLLLQLLPQLLLLMLLERLAAPLDVWVEVRPKLSRLTVVV